MLRNLLVAASAASLVAFVTLGGCGSSSSGGNEGEPDSSGSSSGAGSSSGGNDSGGSSSGSSSGAGSSSGSSSGGDAGGTCANPTTPSASSVPKFVAATVVPGACTDTDISGMVTACFSTSSTSAKCDAWIKAASKSCLDCLGGPTKGEGGCNLNGMELLGPNYSGCVAIEDKANGTACADALEPLVQCEFLSGCDTCTTQSDFDTCVESACSTYGKAEQKACSSDDADGGTLNGGKCSTATEVLTVICGGSAGDGGGGKDAAKE